jgi:hypothetical protein
VASYHCEQGQPDDPATLDALASKINVTKDQMITRMTSLNFLRTPASVSDTAKAAAFLASEPGANDDWNSP